MRHVYVVFLVVVLGLLVGCETGGNVGVDFDISVHDKDDRQYRGFLFLDSDNSKQLFDSLNMPLAKPVENLKTEMMVSSKLADALNAMPEYVTYYSSFTVDKKGRPFNIYVWSDWKDKELARYYANLVTGARYEKQDVPYKVKQTLEIEKPKEKMHGPKVRMW